MGVVGMQTLIGVATIILKAPVYMQVIHLLMADTLWIVLLLLTFEVAARLQDVPAQSLQAAIAGD
jgi:heme A synthase